MSRTIFGVVVIEPWALAIAFGACGAFLIVATWFVVRTRREVLRLRAARDESVVAEPIASDDAATLAESRLARAVDGIPIGVVVCDEDGHPVFRNAAARRFTAGRHAETIVESAVTNLLRRALGGEPVTDTLDLYGPPRWNLVLTAQPLDDRRRPAGAVVVIADVTERRRLEAVRRDFVANISHELKTPVGALGVLAETLADEDDPDIVRRLATRIQQEAFRVGHIIDDLLELSRIEAEERPAREAVPIHLIVSEAVDRVRHGAETNDIKIDVYESLHDASIVGDRRQLVSAVANLLDNAVKYSDPGSRVEVDTKVGDGSVEIVVEDHGIGIPSRDLDRIFERFYRVDRARSRATGGTGLGLAIVRHVANNHDGTVQVQSQEGEGSTFTLVLPTGPRFEKAGPQGEAEVVSEVRRTSETNH
ncbi:MAG: sensor histidine kinase [Acidimicrobiales bacterium]